MKNSQKLRDKANVCGYSYERGRYICERLGRLVGVYFRKLVEESGVGYWEIGAAVGLRGDFIGRCINYPDRIWRGSMGFYDRMAQNLGFEDVVDLIHYCRELELKVEREKEEMRGCVEDGV